MSTSTSPPSPMVFSTRQFEAFKEHLRERGEPDSDIHIVLRKRHAPKCYYVLPAVALLGSVFTYAELLIGHFGGDEKNWTMGKYAGMATAGVIGLSMIATLGETALTKYHYGSQEACKAFKRSWCWLKKPEGIMINTLSAVIPLSWCFWCKES